ncbi:hypothetical protein SRABI76_01158 [Microbacterium oxydans]|uniref:hypothetical protein n=1 Tax=Microbacterium oxydans TaxID=82380 RepID=UPI001DD1216D|nr:hypothetical protein [Microbacterium oxydans]CAH0166100.1 hypothetical protein SRABI76_01158 [Microbacterium oxydans]
MSTELPEIPDAESDTFLDEDGVLYDDDVTPEYGVLGFTLRELLIVGVWAVSFIVSFFPLAGGPSIWGTGIQWILPIGVPTVAVFLLVLRRFSPDGIRRVGSLGIDQFASVAFSVSAVIWVGTLWSAVAGLIEFGVFGLSWSGIVQLVASLALVVLTVFAPIVPGLKEDFQGRLVTLAHRNANPVRPVIARPRPEPEPAVDTNEAEVAAGAEQPGDQTDSGLASTDDRFSGSPATAVTTAYAQPVELDVELSGQQATDEIARFDVADQVPIAAHASGGDTGTEDTAADDEYVPNYSRRSRGQEIASDTASIEALLETAQTVEHTGAVEGDAEPFTETEDWTDDSLADEVNSSRHVDPAQPFWILAPSERDVHDERGEPLFRIGPSAWALVIEDRGGAFVVRHDDGRIGYLHDISDITKG